MNKGRCRSCGTPLPTWSRADRRTCTDLCRKRLSLASRPDHPASGALKARQASFTPAMGHRPTSRPKCERRGAQP
jgi:hypothetical protein